MEISPLDSRILRFTLEEGILDSERSIAKKLKISPSTLSFKLRKFEDKG
ncbi:Lrp/AsnC family transcriptional regulator, partial [archaeon]|nr:Lrp/AsnC family transcriptional regulator [archaeon]